jgi:hypothetical protein
VFLRFTPSRHIAVPRIDIYVQRSSYIESLSQINSDFSHICIYYIVINFYLNISIFHCASCNTFSVRQNIVSVRKNGATYSYLLFVSLSCIGKSHTKRVEANGECNTDCLLQTVSISSNATPMIDFSSVSDCPLNSACVKYHTGGTYSIAKC